MKLRTAIKIGLASLILGTSGWGVGKATNGCNYHLTRNTLHSQFINNPSCKEAQDHLKELKKDDTFLLWKYWRGDYGGMEAYEEYVKNRCQ
jgi:hypothetical protein